MEGVKVLENRILDKEEIMKLIPHRGKLLFLDKIVEIQEKSIVAIKTFTAEECEGHPFNTVPGLFICEAMAQAGAALVFYHYPHLKKKKFFLYCIRGKDGLKFSLPVAPGERITLEVEILKIKMGTCFFRGTASKGFVRVVELEELIGVLADTVQDG